MAEHLAGLTRVLAPALLGYVVEIRFTCASGYERTDIAEIAEQIGYKVERIDSWTRLATATREQGRSRCFVGRAENLEFGKKFLMAKEVTRNTPNRYTRIIEKISDTSLSKPACFPAMISCVWRENWDHSFQEPGRCHSFRYRVRLPASVKSPEGKEWIIRPAGTASYKFEATACSHPSFHYSGGDQCPMRRPNHRVLLPIG